MRPRYESEEDRANEEAFKKKIGPFMGWDAIHKNPVSYHFDYTAFAGTDPALFEYKRRHLSTEKHYSFSIALLKIRVGYTYGQFLNCPVYLFIEFDDEKFGIFNIMLKGEYNFWKLEWGGRFDRNDPADQEPMVRIQFDDMIIHPMSVLDLKTKGDKIELQNNNRKDRDH